MIIACIKCDGDIDISEAYQQVDDCCCNVKTISTLTTVEWYGKLVYACDHCGVKFLLRTNEVASGIKLNYSHSYRR